jgi:hypothetical protein
MTSQKLVRKLLENPLGLTPISTTGETGRGTTVETHNHSTHVTSKRPTKRTYKPRARRCKHCKQSFTPKTKHGKFCCDTCRKNFWECQGKRSKPAKEERLELVTCAGCRQGFFATEGKGQKHCSASCRTKAWRIRRQATIEALGVELGINQEKAADVLETGGMKKITSFLSARGYAYDEVEHLWFPNFSRTD